MKNKEIVKSMGLYIVTTIVIAIAYNFALPFLGNLTGWPPFYIAIGISVILLFLSYTFLMPKCGKKSIVILALCLITVTAISFLQYKEHKFKNGYIMKADLMNHSSLDGLVNKWGTVALPYKRWFFYGLSDEKTYVGYYWNRYGEDEVKLEFYEDQSGVFALLSSVTFLLSNDKSQWTIAQYIEDNYGKIGWSYHDDRYFQDIDFWLNHPVDCIKTTEQKSNSNNNNQGYTDLGAIDCYASNIEDEYINKADGFNLFARSYDGNSMYYIKREYETKYRLLTKGSWTKDGIHFNARTSQGTKSYYYVNVQSWESSSGSSSGRSGGTVIIENNGPRQEWVQCYSCNGSGKCQTCNGTGRNLYMTDYRECVGCGGSGRCSGCAGQGGHYETRY